MEALTSRQLKNDPKSRIETTGKFVAATYKHSANRSLKPHLHDHVVIFNMTPGLKGKNYAVEARVWMDNWAYLTAIYRDELAREAREDGVELVTDEHGAPQIKNLVDLVEIFSRRTAAIEMLVETFEEQVGVKLTNRERKTIVLASRGFSEPDFKALWKLNKESFVKLNDLQAAPEELVQRRREQLNRFKALLTNRKVYDGKLVETTTEAVLKAQRDMLNPQQLRRSFLLKMHRARLMSMSQSDSRRR